MKKIKLMTAVFLMSLCAALSFAGSKSGNKGDRPYRRDPDAMFEIIAEDLKLSAEQQTKYEQITSELKEIKRKSQDKKLDEFKNFIGLVGKGSVSDADIDAYDKVCADNEISSQSEIAAKMAELYAILDPNQQKRFIDKMTFPKPDNKKADNDKNGKKGKNDKKAKNDKKGKKDKMSGKDDRPDRDDPRGRRQGKDNNPAPGKGQSDMRHGDRGMMPHNHFADNCPRPDNCGDMDCPYPDKMKRPHDRHAVQTMVFGDIARELRLSEEQTEIYHRIKKEIRDKMKDDFAKCDKKDKPCDPCSNLKEGLTDQQMRDKIEERVNGQSDTRKYALKKYFEFYGCLTDAQKEVVKLKYQYDIEKMSLPRPNDSK